MHDRIRAALAGRVDDAGTPFGVTAATPVADAGRGETYDVARVDLPRGPVSVRIRRRGPGRAMRAEAIGLALAPAGLVPRPLLVEESSATPIGAPFMVVEHLPGRILSPADWMPAQLRAAARALSRLHTVTSDRCGPIDVPSAERAPAQDGPGLWDATIGPWCEARPELFTPAVEDLAHRSRAIMVERAPLIAARTRFALVHGDATATNVLFPPATTVPATTVPSTPVPAGPPSGPPSGPPEPARLMDLEWVQWGDPAQDLALVGGRVAIDPWYVSLDADGIGLLLMEYRAEADRLGSGHAATGESTADLAHRRDAWEAYERFSMLLHVSARAADQPDSGLYRDAAAALATQLDAILPMARRR